MASPWKHLLAAVLLAVLLGALILVVAYAVGCLIFLAREPYVLGRLPLAVRNSTIILFSLVLGYRLCGRLHRNLRSGWLWILAAPLAVLSAWGIFVFYAAEVYPRASPSTRVRGLADLLESQRGKRLQIPGDVSGVVIEHPEGVVVIILNDRFIQPLFGINIPHVTFLHGRGGGQLAIELAGDSTVKDVSMSDE